MRHFCLLRSPSAGPCSWPLPWVSCSSSLSASRPLGVQGAPSQTAGRNTKLGCCPSGRSRIRCRPRPQPHRECGTRKEPLPGPGPPPRPLKRPPGRWEKSLVAASSSPTGGVDFADVRGVHPGGRGDMTRRGGWPKMAPASWRRFSEALRTRILLSCSCSLLLFSSGSLACSLSFDFPYSSSWSRPLHATSATSITMARRLAGRPGLGLTPSTLLTELVCFIVMVAGRARPAKIRAAGPKQGPVL